MPPCKANKRTAFSKKKISRPSDQLRKLIFLFLSLYPFRPSGLGGVVGRLRVSDACDLARWKTAFVAVVTANKRQFSTRQSTRKAERGRPTTPPTPDGIHDQLHRDTPVRQHRQAPTTTRLTTPRRAITQLTQTATYPILRREPAWPPRRLFLRRRLILLS